MCKFEEIEGWRFSNDKTIREIKNAVHEEVYLRRIYLIISILLAYMGTISMQAQSCEGRVYLKNGIQQLYESNDRIDLPRKKKDVQVYRNFFSRQCTSDVIPFANIDSVVCGMPPPSKTYAHLFPWKMWDGAGYMLTTHDYKSIFMPPKVIP